MGWNYQVITHLTGFKQKSSSWMGVQYEAVNKIILTVPYFFRIFFKLEVFTLSCVCFGMTDIYNTHSVFITLHDAF